MKFKRVQFKQLYHGVIGRVFALTVIISGVFQYFHVLGLIKKMCQLGQIEMFNYVLVQTHELIVCKDNGEKSVIGLLNLAVSRNPVGVKKNINLDF